MLEPLEESGRVVVPVPWDVPPEDECAPDCGILGRYSLPAGLARAIGATASESVAAAISPRTVLRTVMTIGEGAKILPSPPDWLGIR